MAETCIVCLGDLASISPQQQRDCNASTTISELDGAASVASLSPPHDVDTTSLSKQTSKHVEELIAHLLPCGHNLHDDCLKPWVERANSCPICRASFNEVELSATIGGTVLSSYVVQDKQQVADIDATMFTDDDLFGEEEFLSEPCSVCGGYGNDDQLLLCDSCEGSCHTYCIGLDGIPAGSWYCQVCQEERRSSSHGRTQRFGRTFGARRTGRGAHRASAWSQVWQEVWDRLNIDLDFPFDDDERDNRTAQRRDFEEWRRRFEVAQRQGGRNRFTDTASTLLDTRVTRPGVQIPAGESQQELRAWNAFDKARERLDGSPGNGRKRKSTTASPIEPKPEPERRLKRPRTRRAQPVLESTSSPHAGPSRAARRSPRCGSPACVVQGPQSRAAPSFLQSLLREVEVAPNGAENATPPNSCQPSHHSPRGYASPAMSSPEATPPASNLPSPRLQSATPPPFPTARPASPTPLTSTISPTSSLRPSFSPFSPADHPPTTSASGPADLHRSMARRHRPTSRPRDHRSDNRSSDRSPTRAHLTYSTKTEIQKMVSAALKPLYRNQAIDKYQYTDINRDVSRMLYDKVGDASGLMEQCEREKWQRAAAEEVEKAVRALKDSEGIEPLQSNEVTAAAS